MAEGFEDNGNLFQRVPCMHCYAHCPHLCSRPLPTHAFGGDTQTLTGKSGASLFVPSKSLSPVLCKFQWLYGRDNGNFLQNGLCHTHVCCTLSPCPCSRPLLIHASAGDPQILRGRSGSVSCCNHQSFPLVLVLTRFVCALQEFLACVWIDLDIIAPLLPSPAASPLSLGVESLFFGWFQYTSFDGCQVPSYNFCILIGEDEHTSFYSLNLMVVHDSSQILWFPNPKYSHFNVLPNE